MDKATKVKMVFPEKDLMYALRSQGKRISNAIDINSILCVVRLSVVSDYELKAKIKELGKQAAVLSRQAWKFLR